MLVTTLSHFAKKMKRLTEEQKEYIINGKSKGHNATVIGEILGVNSAAVRKFYERHRNIVDLPTKTMVSKRRTDGAIGLLIKRIALNDSTLSIAGIERELKAQLPAEYWVPSNSTIRNYLKRNGFKNVNSKWSVPINEVNRQKRVAFATKWLRNGTCTLGNVIWSDETTVKSNPNTIKKRHWTPASTPRPLQWKVHSGGISQMFWGCISEHGTGPLITIDGTMDSEQYLEVLKKQLLPELEVAKELFGGEWKIMQDNAPCHNAGKVRKFLAENETPMLDWPPFSPDLNPIENLWSWMKRKMPVCRTRDELEEKFCEIWDSITPELCKQFCSNYEKRLKSVLKSRGHATKY